MKFTKMTTEELENEFIEIGDQINELYFNQDLSDEEYFEAASQLNEV